MSIPVGPIPLSLATFAVYLAGSVLGRKKGTIAVALYLVIGVIGVPVFSGFSGGFQKLAGVTGGYLIGYLPCAYLSGVGAEKREKAGWWFHPLMMVAGTVLLVLVLSGSSPAKLPLTVLFMLLILVGFYGIVFQPLKMYPARRKELEVSVTVFPTTRFSIARMLPEVAPFPSNTMLY